MVASEDAHPYALGLGAELLFVDEKLNKQSFRNRSSLRPFKRN
jgi:hypothetical protein